MDWKLILDQLPSRLIQSEGFSVRVYAQHGVRYYEGDRELSLMTGLEDATDRYGRSLLVLPTSETQIFVPESLAWDDGSPISRHHADLIVSRLGEIYGRKLNRHYRVVVGDDFYRRLIADDQQYGP